MDWISCSNYGNGLSVPAGENRIIPLMTIPDIADMDVSAYEGGNASSVLPWAYVKRVVGQIYWAGSTVIPEDPRDILWGWRLMALPWDYTAGDFDAPWAPTDPVLLAPGVTDVERWWAERWRTNTLGTTGATDYDAGLDSFAPPWWVHVDVKPNAKIGMDIGLWPCLVIDNTWQGAPYTLSFRHRLRMLLAGP